VLEAKVPRREYEGIRVIPKQGRASSAEQVVAAISEIARQADSRKRV